MKKNLLLILALAAMASSTFAAVTDSQFIFTPPSQPANSNSTFTVTLSLQVGSTPSPVDGYDLWLATNAANSGLFSITNVTYSSTYSSFGNITTPQPINDTTDISSGYVRNSNDLGNISTNSANDATTGQTIQLATLTISTGALNPGATYTFYTTLIGDPTGGGVAVSSSHYSDVVDQSQTVFSSSQASFSIVAVPEPATWSLLGLGGLGSLGMTLLRRRRG